MFYSYFLFPHIWAKVFHQVVQIHISGLRIPCQCVFWLLHLCRVFHRLCLNATVFFRIMRFPIIWFILQRCLCILIFLHLYPIMWFGAIQLQNHILIDLCPTIICILEVLYIQTVIAMGHTVIILFLRGQTLAAYCLL